MAGKGGGLGRLVSRLADYERAGGSGGGWFELSRIQRLLSLLGNPQHCLRVIHVGGSKGKGSTCTYISSCLSAAGYKCGSFGSPHVHDIRERITARGDWIGEEESDDVARRVEWAAGQMRDGTPTAFEALTASALLHFAGAGMDVAVVEVGLGGRKDATNVFTPDALLTAAVTPIDFEHTDVLGGTIQEIAHAKAGIFKPDRPAVIAQQPLPDAKKSLSQEAEEINASPFEAEQSVQVVCGRARMQDNRLISECTMKDLDGDFPFSNEEVRLGMPGQHQALNASTALACLKIARKSGFSNLCAASIKEGLGQSKLPGRLETARIAGATCILDGAHTPEAAAALGTCLAEASQDEQGKVALVMAAAKDKDIDGIAQELTRALKGVDLAFVACTRVAIAGSFERSACPNRIAEAFKRRANGRATHVAALDDFRQGVEAAAKACGSSGLVCILGSIHAVAAFHSL